MKSFQTPFIIYNDEINLRKKNYSFERIWFLGKYSHHKLLFQLASPMPITLAVENERIIK